MDWIHILESYGVKERRVGERKNSLSLSMMMMMMMMMMVG